MESIRTIIKYDGPAVEEKSMEAAHIAPALLALSNLIKDANAYANGDRAEIKIYVNADLEQNCFELGIVLAIGKKILKGANMLIADDRVKTAKEVIGEVYGLLRLIKDSKNKDIKDIKSNSTVTLEDKKNMINITFEGDSEPKQITEAIGQLYGDVGARQKAIQFLEPLRKEGYDTLEIREGDKVLVTFTKNDIPNKDGSDLPEFDVQNVSIVETAVRIRRAIYEGSSKWILMHRGKAIVASIDDTEWLVSFQANLKEAPPGSTLIVSLEQKYITNEIGEIIGDIAYRVTKVHSVELPAHQDSLGL